MSITKRFWISLIFSLPMLIEMILKPFGWMMPGGEWTMFTLTTVVMVVAAGPFLQSAWSSFKNITPTWIHWLRLGPPLPTCTVCMQWQLTKRFSSRVLLL